MKKNRKKRCIRLIILFLVIVIVGVGVAWYKGWLDSFLSENLTFGVLVERRSFEAFDTNSNERPIAVMIDNIRPAWPHVGLADAYVIYEIIVEGGQTRLMAIFKDQTTAQIGPVRSARHYFLDYALEHDALYMHFGGSPQARTDIRRLNVDDINGMRNSASWRERGRRSPHNVIASIESMQSAARATNSRMTSDQGPALPYSHSRINLSEREDSRVANNITLRYSPSHTTRWRFNAETGLYTRSMNNIEHRDGRTNQPYTFKNILIINARVTNLDGRGRRDIQTTGTGTGYFVTKGHAIPITWEKPTRGARTIYRDLEGNNIRINDGKTFIQVFPSTQTVTF